MAQIRSCWCCGLAQLIPPLTPRTRACCARCGTTLRKGYGRSGDNRLTAAITLAALLLYPLAVSLPMIRVEKFGHHNEASVLEGVVRLLGAGHLLVGVVVLLCSIVLPLGKLLSLLLLSTGARFMRGEHRALTYHVVEWTGRWGMLDVLLLAILVAILKIGDFVQVSAGPAALAFTCCVALSLLAAATFNPHALWSTHGR
ncbi:MAG TPA: paraquat-inducible protein A [Phycisphaerae bacterium]